MHQGLEVKLQLSFRRYDDAVGQIEKSMARQGGDGDSGQPDRGTSTRTAPNDGEVKAGCMVNTTYPGQVLDSIA